MIKTILIDDEPTALKGLIMELQNFSDKIEIVTTFSNAANAVSFLEKEEVEVVFLDMEMPEMDGLTFLEHYPERNFEVVFTTAHSSYAIDAVKSEAVDYLLKPIDAEELQHCIERLEKKIIKTNFSMQLVHAIDKLSQISNTNRKIRLNYDGKIEFYQPDELVYFEASGNYTKVFKEDGTQILLTKKMKQLEEELPTDLFFRIHNSFIVNLSKIKSFYKNEGFILLENNVQLPVAKQRRSNILGKI